MVYGFIVSGGYEFKSTPKMTLILMAPDLGSCFGL